MIICVSCRHTKISMEAGLQTISLHAVMSKSIKGLKLTVIFPHHIKDFKGSCKIVFNVFLVKQKEQG